MNELENIPYGFRWGPVTVERLMSDKKWGVVLLVTTPRQTLQVRVTPTGFIRLGALGKGRREYVQWQWFDGHWIIAEEQSDGEKNED